MMGGNETEAVENNAESQTQAEPATLQDAFKKLRQTSSQDASDTMEEGENNQTDLRQGGLQEDSEGIENAGATSYGDGDTTAGGFVPSIAEPTEENQVVDQDESEFEDTDYTDLRNIIVKSVQQQAAMEATRKFQELGLSKITMSNLYQRDENTGRVTFLNPDDPNHPFDNRAQAQAFIDSYNKDIDNEWNNYRQQVQNQYANETLPAWRLMEFAPTFDKMDKTTQDVFDTLITPYEVRDKTGTIIGYSCDLNAAHRQASSLVSVFGKQATNTAQTATPQISINNEPALDATTTGSGTANTSTKEPKNLQDAFKIINEAKKKGNK